MVDPGASSEEIEEEIFKEFRAKIEQTVNDEKIGETITETITSDQVPHNLVDDLIEVSSIENES